MGYDKSLPMGGNCLNNWTTLECGLRLFLFACVFLVLVRKGIYICSVCSRSLNVASVRGIYEFTFTGALTAISTC